MKTSEIDKTLTGWIKALEQEEKAPSTLKTYKNAVNTLKKWLESNGTKELGQPELLEYKRDLTKQQQQGKIKTSTVNTRIIAINKFLRENGEPELKLKVEKLQQAHTLNDTLTLTDYNRLLRWAGKLGMRREELIMKTLVNTGIRISELEFFTVESIKRLKGRNNSKGLQIKNKGKTRTVYPTKKLVKELLGYCKENGIESGVIFHGNDPDRLLNKSVIWQNMKKIAGKARVKKSRVHAHSFRHLFAKEYLDRPGANIAKLANILGHSSIETTRIYITGTDTEQSEDVTGVEAAIEKKLRGMRKK